MKKQGTKLFRITDKYKEDNLPEKRDVERSNMTEKYKFINNKSAQGMHEEDNEKASLMILSLSMPENYMKQPYYKNNPFFNKKLKKEKYVKYDHSDFKILQQIPIKDEESEAKNKVEPEE